MSAWPLVPLKYVARINPETLTDRTPLDYRFQYIDISQVDSAGRISLSREDVAFAQAPSRARRIVKPEDVIISTVRTYLRAIARVPDNADKVVVSTGFAVARANHRVDSRFLGWACQSAPFIDQVVARSTGISYPAINPSDLAAISIPLPPLEEQRRIANYLDDQTTRIDQTIQLRQQQTKLLLDGRRSALSELVGSLRGPLVPLGRLLRPRQEPGDVHSMVLSIYREHGVVPRDSRSDNFNRPPEDVARYQRVHRGDLVINKMKAWSGSVAVSPFDGVVSPDYLVCRPTAYVVNEFLHYVLRSPEWISHMRANSRGIRPQQERLYWQDLASITVPLPSARDQADFVHLAGQRIRSFDELSDPFRRSLSALEERRQAVVTAAVTGIA